VYRDLIDSIACSHSENPRGPSPCRCKSLRDRCLLKTKSNVQGSILLAPIRLHLVYHKEKVGLVDWSAKRCMWGTQTQERAPCQALAEGVCSAKLNQRGGLKRWQSKFGIRLSGATWNSFYGQQPDLGLPTFSTCPLETLPKIWTVTSQISDLSPNHLV